MAEWKKVIVSGSNAELNTVTASYFSGDGSALTNVPAGSINIESFTDGTAITVASTDKLILSDGGDEKYINVSQLPFTVNTNTQLSNEQVEDIVGGMLGGTETGITVTYQDSTGDIDFVVASQTDENFTTADHSKLDGIEAGAEVNLTAAETRDLVGTGNNGVVPAAGSAGQFLKHDGTFGTPSYTTNTNTQLTQEQVEDFVGGMLDGTETGITVGYDDINGNLDFVVASQTDENFTTADHSKLDGIEAGAEVNLTAAETRTLVGTGNAGVIPTIGTAGHFLKHDGTFGLPSYTTNTDTQLTATEVRANLSGTGLIGYDNSTGVISTTANNYVHPTGAGNKHIPTGGAAGNFLRYQSSGTAVWSTPANDKVSVSNLKAALAGGFGSNEVQIGDADDVVTIGNKLVVTGNLTVSGTTTTVDTANLNVTDQFINLNDGGSAADGGIVVEGAGVAYGWDNSAGRWAFDAAGATEGQSAITSDAFASAVVTSDLAAYRKNGNIRVEADEIYIYTE